MIATFKMSYKQKLVAWTLQQFDKGSVQDLGKLINFFGFCELWDLMVIDLSWKFKLMRVCYYTSII